MRVKAMTNSGQDTIKQTARIDRALALTSGAAFGATVGAAAFGASAAATAVAAAPFLVVFVVVGGILGAIFGAVGPRGWIFRVLTKLFMRR